MGPQLFSRGDYTTVLVMMLHIWASMGPQLFSRGDENTRVLSGSLKQASMGPQLFSRGDTCYKQWNYCFILLQWGHSFSAVEILVVDHSVAAFHASMGPQLFSRGDGRMAHVFDGVPNMLQWGHSFSAVEMRIRGGDGARSV